MSSLFDDLVAGSLQPAIDTTFARQFHLLPRKKSADRNAPVVADPSRAEQDFAARLHTPRAKPLITNAYDARTDQRPGTAAEHPMLRISPLVVASLAGIGTDDIVVDLATNQRWRVSSARTTATGVRECVVELV